MQVAQLSIQNFRGIREAKIDFDGHTLLVGQNNVGKSTIFEALELGLGPERQARFPVVEEYDFYNAAYLDAQEEPVAIRIEILLIDVTATVERACVNHLERWDPKTRRVLGQGELKNVDDDGCVWCLRLLTVARYNREEDEFEASTHYAKSYEADDEDDSRVPRSIRRSFGFLYLRTLRTGSRALSLERGSLLDAILRIQSLQTGIWEHVRRRLENLAPPIEQGAVALTPVLQAIESRLAEYIPMANPGDATKLFVSQLTREHLRKTLSFFLSVAPDQKPVPFHEVGTGTLNALVLALLSFIAELKEENVIFAMEEPEIALPPHTQRRIVSYLLAKTTQCFVTSHSPYVIEHFEPERIVILRRDGSGVVTGKKVALEAAMKAKTYRRQLRRGLAEAMLGRAVIVAEGFTEQVALRAVAEKLEAHDETLYPLDLAGVTVVSADGDGSVAEFGRFFAALDVPTYAILDKKTRNSVEWSNLNSAGFACVVETAFSGMEDLLAAEVPTDHQWTFLGALRDGGASTRTGIPPARPDDAAIKTLTSSVLKDGKGWGRAADLVELCARHELPVTLTNFLGPIYERFPRPPVPEPARKGHATPAVEERRTEPSAGPG